MGEHEEDMNDAGKLPRMSDGVVAEMADWLGPPATDVEPAELLGRPPTSHLPPVFVLDFQSGDYIEVPDTGNICGEQWLDPEGNPAAEYHDLLYKPDGVSEPGVVEATSRGIHPLYRTRRQRRHHR